MSSTKAPTKEQKRLAAQRLMRLIMRTFFQAFHMRTYGRTEDEMLIEYDIEAAGFGVDRVIADITRTSIRIACNAVEAKLPFDECWTYLLERMELRVVELLKTTKGVRAATVDGLPQHVLCPWCNQPVPINQPLHDCQ